jgi:hypothetical protein
MSGELTFALAPLVPMVVIIGLAAAAFILLAALWWSRARGALWRTVAFAALLLTLLNPAAVIEDRQPLPDVAVVVVDDSPSQNIGQRRERTEAALKTLQDRLGHEKGLELRVVHAGAQQNSLSGNDGTRLFEAVERALGDVPRSRLAGVIMLTDGQVHDAPKDAAAVHIPAPVHVLLTGEHHEIDRRLVVERAPTYGIVGKPQAMTIRIDDGPDAPKGETARVDMIRDGGAPQSLRVPVGVPTDVDFTLDHEGPTIFELTAEAGPKELTLENNRAVVVVNGIRDRLRVLLVTGEPNPGERAWRNLLKSDPSVDLVHFTILRPPEAQDFTPVNELSLIAFPIRELFEVKLHEFDLVIFDRYRRRDVLAQVYLDNIVNYVKGGGALLVSTGPDAGGNNNLFNSPLGQILPGVPTGRIFEQPFRPKVTALGRRHPVTADLPDSGHRLPDGSWSEPTWGRWFRHIDIEPRRGEVLMSGVDDRPLLMLDRVGSGRVAQIMSDQIWLWARGYEGGGPATELLRRIAHWLMKEPDLEENDLRAVVKGNQIEVIRQSLEKTMQPVEVTTPSGHKQSLTLTDSDNGDGRATGSFQVTESGLYHITDGQRMAIAAVGALNPVEFADVRTTEDKVRTAVTATGGQIDWLVDGMPDIRRVRPGRDAGGREPGGRGWIGLRENGDYVVVGITQVPLLPGLAVFVLALLTLVLAWRREGR